MTSRVTERLAADAAGLARAAEILRAGGLVAFPTETVYGLGARADRPEAVRDIFAAKGRPSGNPLIVHVSDASGAKALAETWPREAEALASAFWPGPLTLVVLRAPGKVADEVAAFGDTVGLRAPAHPVARALLLQCALPIAAPSANPSTAISPTTAAHVHKALDGRIDAVLDGGATGFGIESSVVDVTRSPARLLRHGALPLDALVRVTPIEDATAEVTPEGARAPSPGTAARHYAPRAALAVVAAPLVAAEVARRRAAGELVGSIELGEPDQPGASTSLSVELPADPLGYAAGFYAALHGLDDAGCTSIVVRQVPDGPAWAAIRDRLRRAAAR